MHGDSGSQSQWRLLHVERVVQPVELWGQRTAGGSMICMHGDAQPVHKRPSQSDPILLSAFQVFESTKGYILVSVCMSVRSCM